MTLPETVFVEIEQFVSIFKNNSFNFLYESDIQYGLARQLSDATRNIDVRLPKKPPSGNKQGHYGPFEEYEFVMTNMVHLEYGPFFDIALLDPNGIQTLNEQATNDGFWSHPIRIAIEVKFQTVDSCKIADNKKITDFFKDIEKLRNYREKLEPTQEFLGIAILFLQAYNWDIRSSKKLIGSTIHDELLPLPEKGIVSYLISPSWQCTII